MSDSNREIAENYLSMREMALSLQAEQIGLLDPPPNQVILLLMEMGMPDATVSLAGVIDGSASLYFSNGGGIIGGGENAAVREVCLSWLAHAEEYLPLMNETAVFPLPAPDRVRFYLVTPNGVFTRDASELDLGNNQHDCSELFFHGHALITAIREHTPD